VTFGQRPVELAEAIRRAENDVASRLVEVVHVLAPDGSTLYRGAGTRDQVSAPRGILTGAIVIHNHPSGDSFSRSDVHLLLERKIAHMRVVTNDAVYTLDLPADTEWEDVEGLVTIIMDEVRERHRALILAGQLTYEQSERRRWHDVWTEVAAIRGWAYLREPRMST
jgi:hypothetical protein